MNLDFKVRDTIQYVSHFFGDNAQLQMASPC
jgi:hypothetical protein